MADIKKIEALIAKLKKDVSGIVNSEGETDIAEVRKQKKKLKRAQRKLSSINDREKKLKERMKKGKEKTKSGEQKS